VCSHALGSYEVLIYVAEDPRIDHRHENLCLMGFSEPQEFGIVSSIVNALEAKGRKNRRKSVFLVNIFS